MPAGSQISALSNDSTAGTLNVTELSWAAAEFIMNEGTNDIAPNGPWPTTVGKARQVSIGGQVDEREGQDGKIYRR